VGTLADLTVFSFHPVKHVTTGEGGMVVTSDADLAARCRTFRNHGITTDHRQRSETGAWFYEMVDLGYNYRITDIQCALGTSQMRKLPPSWPPPGDRRATTRPSPVRPSRRTPSAAGEAARGAARLPPLRGARGPARPALPRAARGGRRGQRALRPGASAPVLRQTLGTGPGLCPVAEAAAAEILSLPMFPP
jgi:perosamine synthetase